MTIVSCKSLKIVAAAVALASSSSTLAADRTDDAFGHIANDASIFIDGQTFEIVPGKARGDVSAQIKSLGARELGPGVIVFRSGDKLYIVGGGGPPAGQQVSVAVDQTQQGPIRIAYEAPKNPEHQKIYEMVKERHVLETLQKIFSPFRLPVDLAVKMVGCDGVSNAWYEREKSGPTIRLCYEYLQEVWDSMPKETTAAGVTPSDAVVGQLFFAMAHEFGHAMFDIFDVPIFGRGEDAADQFAAYIMLQFGGDRAHRLVAGAAYSYREFFKDYQNKPKVTLPLAAFSSDHGSPEERFYNLLCVAYGYDAKVFADVVDKEYLPQRRAKYCDFEYQDLTYAMRQLIGPHVDRELAKKVLETRWLTDASTGPARR